MNRWTLLPLDMSSRVESVQMNIVPRLLYPFQTLPVEIPHLSSNGSTMIKGGENEFKALQLAKE